MGLPWIRLDTNMFDHPKILALFATNDYRAIVVHLAGMAYSGKHSTNGFLPREILSRLEGRPRDAERLVKADVWTAGIGGWDINGWDEYQVSDEDAQVRREKAKKAAEARWSKHDKGAA